MWQSFREMFFPESFLPQKSCFGSDPALLWSLGGSDLLIAIAYYTIPLALLHLVNRRKELTFNWIFLLFSGFLFASGTTHLLGALSLWRPVYWLDAGFTVVTAVLSVMTAIVLWPLLPRVLALPSATQMAESYRELERQVAVRQSTEATLRGSEERYRQLSETLEGMINQRTGELEQANRELQREIDERVRVQNELQDANSLMGDSLGLLEQRSQKLTYLNQMSSLLQTSRSTAEMCGIAAQFAQGLFKQSSGALFTMDASRTVVEASAQWGDIPANELVMNPNDCWAIRRGKPHPENGAAVTLACRHGSRELPQHVCVPMLASGETLGVLHLRGDVDLADRHNRLILETMAERVALSLANIRLREHLLAQSIRDPLTELYNRRYLEETLLMEERRARRAGAPFGVVMFDLDHFKALNDRHGHDAGDAALRTFSTVLQAQSRAGDVACRYGGEEFTLVLPGASLDVTQARAERIRTSLAATSVTYGGTEIGPLTVSAGVAAYPEHGISSDTMLRAADEALYRAKQAGRNCTRAATGLMEPLTA